MNANQSFIIGLVAAIMIFIHFTSEKLINGWKQYNDCDEKARLLNLTQKQLEEIANNEIILSAKIDSIIEVKSAERSAVASRNKNEITRELDRVKYNLNNVTDITFWGKHNGGKVMSETSKIYFELYISTDSSLQTLYSEKRPMPKGLDYLSNELLENNFKYIPSIKEVPNLYMGKAKSYFDSNGSKSLIGALIKNKGTDWYFVTISFNIENPTDHNDDLFATIRSLRTYINKRIL